MNMKRGSMLVPDPSSTAVHRCLLGRLGGSSGRLVHQRMLGQLPFSLLKPLFQRMKGEKVNLFLVSLIWSHMI